MKTNFITKYNLKKWIEGKFDFYLIDVLPQEYYDEEHIVSAHNACVFKTSFIEDIQKIGLLKTDTIVVYGASIHSMDSMIAAKKLMDAGYKNVYVYRKGINEWKKRDYPLIKNSKKKTVVLDFKNKKYVVERKDSLVEWTGRNFNGKHNGNIEISKGYLKFENDKLVEGEFQINMKKITNYDLKDDTYKKYLIEHLMSDDFFEVDKYPNTKIVFKYIERLNTGENGERYYRIIADLTIKDITRPIEFEAIIGHKNKNKFVQTQFSINRTNWNVIYGSNKFFEKLGMHLVNDWIDFDIYVVLS